MPFFTPSDEVVQTEQGGSFTTPPDEALPSLGNVQGLNNTGGEDSSPRWGITGLSPAPKQSALTKLYSEVRGNPITELLFGPTVEHLTQVGAQRGVFSPDPNIHPLPIIPSDPNRGTLGQIGSAVYNVPAGAVNSVLANPLPLAAFGLPGQLPRVAGLLTGGVIGSQVPGQISQAVDTAKNPNATLQDKIEAGAQPVVSSLSALGLVKMAKEPINTEPINYRPGMDYIDVEASLIPEGQLRLKGPTSLLPENVGEGFSAPQEEVVGGMRTRPTPEQMKWMGQRGSVLPEGSGPKGGPESELSPEDQAKSRENNSPNAWGSFGGLNKGQVVGEQMPEVPQPRFSPVYVQSEKDKGREMVLEGPVTVEKDSGFPQDKPVSDSQLMGRMQNLVTQGKMSQGELQGYVDGGLKEFVQEAPRTPQEIGKWMQENGPRVEVRKFGTDQKALVESPDSQELARLQHEFFDTQPMNVQNSLRSFMREWMEDQWAALGLSS
jgi:hypothetical protein